MRRVFALLLLLLLAVPIAAATLRGIEISGGAEPVVTVSLTDAIAAPRTFVLDGPQRIVVDFDGVASVRRSVDATGGAIVRVRASQFDPQTVRLVIELARPMRLIAAHDTNDRLTLRLAPASAIEFAKDVGQHSRPVTRFDAVAASDDFNLPDALGAAPVAPVPEPPATPLPLKHGARPLVMIDAGHGGKDTGTISIQDGRYEKDVTLAIALATAHALERSGKVRVKLTRSNDRFIPLGGRVALARGAKADLFVSIHADSAPNPLARGASVYTLSEVASDAVAERLAARENTADIIAGVNLGVDAPGVGDIIIDLARRDTMNASVAFAEVLQDSLEKRIGFRGEFHHFAGFYVLKAPDVPSVLLETGYLSNADDAQLLLSTDGQATIGKGVAQAIEHYFAHPGR
jgi:N-acetylmuramoyl-L-alanine amidase